MMIFPYAPQEMVATVGCSMALFKKDYLALLRSGLARGDAVDEVASKHNQDS